MIPKPQAEHRGGRPRIFSDDAIFQATNRVLIRGGHGRLNLPAVARELGCSRQTLIHRFRTKRELLLAYLAWSNEQIRIHFQAVRAEQPTPLAALRARLTMPIAQRPEEIADAPGYAYHMGFTMEAQHDSALRSLIQQRVTIWETEFAKLIAEATAAGELTACDAATTARQLMITATGASTLWTIDPRGSITDALLHAFETTIEPLRLTRESDGPATKRS